MVRVKVRARVCCKKPNPNNFHENTSKVVKICDDFDEFLKSDEDQKWPRNILYGQPLMLLRGANIIGHKQISYF